MKITQKYIRKNDNFDVQIINNLCSLLDTNKKSSDKEIYRALSGILDIELEDEDYLEYASFKTGHQFTRVESIYTDRIISNIDSEELSWIANKKRLWFDVLVDDSFEESNKYFTIDEIKELIVQNKIYPLCSYFQVYSGPAEPTGANHDIECLTTKENGIIDVNAQYFDFIVDKIKRTLSIGELVMYIRNYIVNTKITLDCIDESEYSESEQQKIEQSKVAIERLIDIYNNFLETQKNQGVQTASQPVSHASIDLIIEYIISLSNLDKEDWYSDITLDQIAIIMDRLDYEKEQSTCDKVQNLAIALNDPELLFEMVIKVDWVDLDKLSGLIAESKNLECNYYLLEYEIRGLDSQKHAQVIIDSCDPEYNHKLACLVQECGLDISIIKIGEAVIKSKNCFYNYLFAYEIEGADVREHGRVVIESGNQYYNNLFATDIPGADIDAHMEAYLSGENQSLESGKKLMFLPKSSHE